MPRKALSRSSLLAGLVLAGLLSGISLVGPVRGQVPGVPPGPGFSGFNTAPPSGPLAGGTGTTIPGTGNPFVRRGFPRATLMAPQAAAPLNFDAALTPVAFDQPLDNQAPAGSPPGAGPQNFQPQPSPIAQPGNFAQPSTSVLPNYADPGAFSPNGATPIPGPQNPAPQNFTQQNPAPAGVPVGGSSVPGNSQSGLAGVALLRSLSQNPPTGGHPLIPILAWCDGALQQMQGLADYTCTFKKREFVDGKMQEQQSMFVKSRPNPLSVYLHFLAPRDIQGQEAIYVAGKNEGRILAHPVGFKQKLVGTVALEPTDPQAMGGNRHPITDFGLRRLCERFREGLQGDLQFGECDLRILDNVVVEGRPCVCIQISHPTPRQEFKFNVTRLFVDAEWNLPIRLEGYAWPQRPGEQPMLVEEYTYANLKLNVGLTEADFDVRNPQYRY